MRQEDHCSSGATGPEEGGKTHWWHRGCLSIEWPLCGWYVFIDTPVFTFQGCCSNFPHTGWLKAAEIYPLTILESRSPESKC